jgi:hypothetical protein
MATVKEYAYYVKGTKLALIEKDTAFDNDPNAKDYGPGADHASWKSPLSAVTDGIEIEYTHAPTYRIESIAAGDQETATSYETASGFLRFNGTGFSTESSVEYIVVSGSERWNGLHKVTGLNTAHYTTSTKYSGANVTDTPTIYTNVDILNDEADEIDLPSYLTKALVNYVKARIAEDQLNIEMKEYFMKEFRKMVEKYDSTRVWGPRMVVPGHHAIR